MSPEELEYYRTHFLEAIREDGVVCLECGTMHRALGLHLRLRHSMEVDPYKQAWGYNRQTALMIPAVVQAHREKALAMDLYSKSPPDAFLKAQEASRRYRRSYRREARLKDAATGIRGDSQAGGPRFSRDRSGSILSEALRGERH